MTSFNSRKNIELLYKICLCNKLTENWLEMKVIACKDASMDGSLCLGQIDESYRRFRIRQFQERLFLAIIAAKLTVIQKQLMTLKTVSAVMKKTLCQL